MDPIQFYMQNPQFMQQQGGGQSAPPPSAPPPPMLTQTGYNPITAGTLAAMKSAKQSIGADDDDRRKAMGMAMMQFAHGMGKTGYGSGIGGAINAASQNLFPAYQTYQGGIDNSQARNHIMLNNQLEMERQHRAEEYRRQRDIQEDRISRERMHVDKSTQRDMMKQLHLEQKSERMIAEGKMPAGATLIESMTPGEKQQVHKEMSESLNEGIAALKGKSILGKMDNIISSNPGLWNSYAQIVAAEESDPTLAKQMMAKLNKPDLDKIKILQKYTNSLGLNEIKTIGGRPTDILKKTVFEAVASGKLSPEAFKEIKTSMEEGFDKSVSQAQISKEGLKNRWYMPKELNVEKPIQEEEAKAPIKASQSNPFENISDEELEARIAAKRTGQQ